MKVLMVLQHINFFRSMDRIVRELDARGHETTILHGTPTTGPIPARKGKTMVLGRAVAIAEAELSRVTTGYRPEPDEEAQKKLRVGRQVINTSIYFNKRHPSNRSIEGIEKGLPPALRDRVNSRIGRMVLNRPSALRAWRRRERKSPPSDRLTTLIEELAPDVLLVTPGVWPKGPIESDYVHAALSMGIPAAGFVSGWDNLTSKGTVHRLPTVLIVWNQAMAEEAHSLHRIPEELIEISGAPYLDRLFSLETGVPRSVTCARLGLPDDRPYVVYLCSSRTIIANENHVVTALADALEHACPGEPPHVVVRPHPVSAETWEGFAHPRVVVSPRRGTQAETPYQWQEYHDQLSHASCVVGLNTSAFLEAVVVDRPCLTVVSDEFYDQQGATGHFRHLLDGGFLEVSGDLEAAAERVQRILEGADENAEQRRRFAESFLRPHGLDTPASAVVTDALERIAGVSSATTEGEGGLGRSAPPTRLSSPVTATGGADDEPFFTVAIPTKNRPDRVENAVRSTLDQTFGDFEVVVCDNSDVSEAPETARAVEGFDDRRVRYVRTDGTLSMPDNWDRSIEGARGRYVLILTDRSVLRRDALQVAHAEIDATGAKVLMWPNDLYGRDPDGAVFKRRECTFERYFHTSHAWLEYFLSGHPKYAPKVIPKLMAGACARDVLEEIRRTTGGRVCVPVSPDFTSGFLMLAHSDWVLAIDEALYVSCGTGNGSQFRQRGELADRFRADLGLEWREMVDRMPSEACFSTATMLNDFMKVRDIAGGRLDRFSLDRAQYYVGCLNDYVKTSRHNVFRNEDVALLLEALEHESPEVQELVKGKRYYDTAVRVRASAGDAARREQVVDAAKQGANGGEPTEGRPRFDDVFEAMAWDRAHPRSPASATYLDLTIGFDQLPKSKARYREKARERKRAEKDRLKAVAREKKRAANRQQPIA